MTETVEPTLCHGVRRLDVPEMAQIVMQIGSRRAEKVKFYGPVNPAHLVKSWGELMKLGTGRAYAAFKEGVANAFFLGFVTLDFYTGEKQGIEFLWIAEPGARALNLLRQFEKDCKAEGCVRMVAGLLHCSDVPPWKLRRIYEARGYVPHGESFSRGI
jgi:hypothetical protein